MRIEIADQVCMPSQATSQTVVPREVICSEVGDQPYYRTGEFLLEDEAILVDKCQRLASVAGEQATHHPCHPDEGRISPR